MIGRRLLLLIAGSVAGLCLLAGALALPAVHRPLLRRVLERQLNRAAAAHFHGSLRVGYAGIDRQWRLELRNLGGTLRTERSSIPLVIEHAKSLSPVTDFLLGRRLTIAFAGAKPRGSTSSGVSGVAHLYRGPPWSFELQARISELALQELAWLSPSNLQGASGSLRGELALRLGDGVEPYVSLKLKSPEPGGQLPAKVFALLARHVPHAGTLQELSTKTGLVRFTTAALAIELPQSDRMTVVLRISVPEYNLQVNLNLEVHIDERHVLGQLMTLLGLLSAR